MPAPTDAGSLAMIRCVLVLTLSTAVVSGVAAETPCRGAATSDLDACAAAELEAANAELNRTYRTLMGRIGPRSRQALRAAEEAWLTFRERSCALEILGTEGGSAQRLVELTCLRTTTEERTKGLRRYLTCEEGDLACVGRSGP